MWAIANRTRYKAGKTWARDKDGVHEWIVCVKATFDVIAGGSVVLSENQVDPLPLAEYRGEPGSSSLAYDADLVPMKPTTDVVLNATAYAPRGRASTDFLVSVRVGPIRKTIRVRGNREWTAGAFGERPSAAEPITQVPVVYERAYGGYDRTNSEPARQRMDARNPVGCGVVAESSRRAGLPLPNFEYPDGDLEKSGPAGFGAIDCYWSPRRELAGTYDDAWDQHRRPLVPADWDPRSLLCAPADQRPDAHLRGGELVELSNLTPDGDLRFTLPKTYLTFSTRVDTRIEEHRGRLATVIIEPDYPRVIMVWLTSLTCRTDADYLEETVIREKPFLR
jgi:hypothetical protein